MIRTCTVNKLLDSDSFISSFTLKLDGNNDVHVVSGLIASCKDDGCNSARSFVAHKTTTILFSTVLVYFMKRMVL